MMRDIKLKLDQSPLGSGNFGRVYAATWRGRPVAAKCLRDEDDKEAFLREGKIWQFIRSPNCVAFFGYTRHDDNRLFLGVLLLLQLLLFSS